MPKRMLANNNFEHSPKRFGPKTKTCCILYYIIEAAYGKVPLRARGGDNVCEIHVFHQWCCEK